MKRAFRIIKGRHKKKSQRGVGQRFMGLKSIECNFNPTKKWYNPHFHLIVPNKETAELIINEWVTLWTKRFTNRAAQDYRKVSDRQKDLIEVIKYEAKIFTEADGEKNRKKKGTAKIYVRALDTIYAALKGTRLIDRFGF